MPVGESRAYRPLGVSAWRTRALDEACEAGGCYSDGLRILPRGIALGRTRAHRLPALPGQSHLRTRLTDEAIRVFRLWVAGSSVPSGPDCRPGTQQRSWSARAGYHG